LLVLDHSLYRVQQILIAEWLGEKFHRTGFHHRHRQGDEPVVRFLTTTFCDVLEKMKTIVPPSVHLRRRQHASVCPTDIQMAHRTRAFDWFNSGHWLAAEDLEVLSAWAVIHPQ
jgi:GrpB-like predicted nucleotidyltransferase (UPF0157 family)